MAREFCGARSRRRHQAPPAELFDTLLDAIDAGEEALLGTLTRRAGTGVWAEMAPGVTCTVLLDDPVTKRRSMLVRALAEATYESHHHDNGQSCAAPASST